MQENNQSRTMLYAVLIGLGVVILGLGIWLVMRSDDTSSSGTTASTTTSKSSSSANPTATMPSGYKAYSNNVLAYSFGFPEAWKAEPNVGSNTADTTVTFKSPDFAQQAAPEGGNAITKGALVTVNVSIGVAPVQDTASNPVSSKTITVSGVSAQQKTYKVSSYYTTVTTFQGSDKFTSSSKTLTKGARYFTVTMAASDAPESSASGSVLQQILSSFKIN